MLNCSNDNNLLYTGTIHDKMYAIYYSPNPNKQVSFWHGIDLYPNFDNKDIVNMVIEIPQGTQEKMEIDKETMLNPIMYDIKNGQVRLVTYAAKGSKYEGYPFHYGALPQTWEHKYHVDKQTGMKGDNDPIDCFDISSNPSVSGLVRKVKILGAFSMIDNDETDWKLVCIDCNDVNASKYNDIKDVPDDVMNIIDDFLTNYKNPDGKSPNKFGLPKVLGKKEALKIVEEVHDFWRDLTMRKGDIVNGADGEDKVAIKGLNMCVERVSE